MKRISFFFLFINLLILCRANVVLPSIFSDHMVLQQNRMVKIWGWGKPGENIIVTSSWDNVETKTAANNQANWNITIKTPAAGGPYIVTVKGYNTLVINDVLIGEVWVCSGQSNMEWTPGAGIDNGEQEIKSATNANIRFFSVAHRSSSYPQLDVVGEWKVCSPKSMNNFSAIGYFFGKKLTENLNLPVGLINSSWGGTPAEIWMNSEDLNQDAFLVEGSKSLPEVPWGPKEPGVAFNAMISPIAQFSIAGAIWYQGEGNVGLAKYYTKMLSALIKSWRKAWTYEFPFYYVQIAPYKYGTPFIGVEIQNAQRLVKEPNSGMIVINDIGDTSDIHPKNKIEVGYRLANMALGKHYGKTGITVSGPLYREIKIEKNKIRVFFDYAENGLKTTGKTIKYFEIAGKDKVFYQAIATIDKSTVIATSKNVKEPEYIRFAWSNTAVPTLFNIEGLPASSFITENFRE